MSIMRTMAAGVAAAVGLGVVAVAAAAQEHQHMAPRPAIQTSAMAEVRVTPDRATISLGVTTRAATVAQATAENARLQRAVIEAVRGRGIPAERIGTTGFSVHPEYRHDPRGEQQPRITGFVANNIVRVEIHEIEQVGPVIDAALAAGANNIHGLHFWAANQEEARRRALGEAVTRARADAEAMARAAGGKLGTLELLQHGVIPEGIPMQQAYRVAMADAAEATPISPGEQTIRVTVTGRWTFAAP